MARKSKANFRKPHKSKVNPKPEKDVDQDLKEKLSPQLEISTLPKEWLKWKWLFLILGFGLYANTVSFQYALDDKLYVTDNHFVKEGVTGIPDLITHDLLYGFYQEDKNLLEGGRYRPLPLITHALEYQLFGENPAISHFVNAALYGLTAMLLFLVLLRLIPPDPKSMILASIPFIAAILWTVHPIHTEVTANIKSRDELMAVLFSLIALQLFFRYAQQKSMKYLLGGVGIFFLALMSRESVATWAAGIPLAVYFFSNHFIEDPQQTNVGKNIVGFLKNRENQLTLGTIAVTTLIYLGIRGAALPDSEGTVFPELMNQPFMLVGSTAEHYATIFYTMWMYIKLLFVPHPLTHDYYPFAIAYTNWSNPFVLLSVLCYLGLALMAIIGIVKRTVVGFGALFFLLNFLLVSNLFFDVGSFMNERWMYVPSIGFCLILAWGIVALTRNVAQAHKVRLAIVLPVALVFSVLTFNRNYAWENDQSLALTDVYTSTGSAKAHMAAGSAFVRLAEGRSDSLSKINFADSAVVHLNRSLEIYPNWYQPMDLLGSAYFQKGDLATSVLYYKNVLQIKKGYDIAIRNLTILGDKLSERNQFNLAIDVYSFLLDQGHPSADVYAGLGKAYGKSQRDFNQAIQYLELARQQRPNDATILENLGICFASLGRFSEGMPYFELALQQKPNNLQLMRNMAVVYQQMGNNEKAQEMMARSQGANSKN